MGRWCVAVRRGGVQCGAAFEGFWIRNFHAVGSALHAASSVLSGAHPHSKSTKSHSSAGLKRVATGSAGFRLRHPALLRPVTIASEANPGCSKRHRAANAVKTAKVPLGCVPLCGNDLPPNLRPLEGFRLSTLNLVRPRHPPRFLAKHTHDLPCPPPLRRFLSTLLPPPLPPPPLLSLQAGRRSAASSRLGSHARARTHFSSLALAPAHPLAKRTHWCSTVGTSLLLRTGARWWPVHIIDRPSASLLHPPPPPPPQRPFRHSIRRDS